MEDFIFAATDVGVLQRLQCNRVTVESDELDVKGLAVPVDQNHGAYITLLQPVLREVACQDDGVEFFNHVPCLAG